MRPDSYDCFQTFLSCPYQPACRAIMSDFPIRPSRRKSLIIEWKQRHSVLTAFHLAKDVSGRQAHVAWLKQRAAKAKGEIDSEAMATLRRGWDLGAPLDRHRIGGIRGQRA